MYGEALINYGPYIAPIAILVIGFIFTKLTYLSKNDLMNNSLRTICSLIACITILQLFRGNMAYELKIYVYRMVVFVGLIESYKMYYKSKKRTE